MSTHVPAPFEGDKEQFPAYLQLLVLVLPPPLSVGSKP